MGSASGRSDPSASILLVGFMGAGKTSVAGVLSHELGWPAFDVDALLEDEIGVSVQEIFASRGETWFREREEALTAGLLARHGVIVAPGGGWAAHPGRLAGIQPHVLSVWLQVSAEEAVRRGRSAPGTRPLLGDEERMKALLRHREPFYREAQLHLDTEAAPPIEVARQIIDHLAER